MAGVRKDIVIEGGASFHLALQWPKDAPYDLSSGWVGLCQLRRDLADAVAAYDFGTAIVVSAGSPTAPNIVLNVTPEVTAVMVDGNYHWALGVSEPGSDYARILLYGMAAKVTRAIH